VIILEIRRQVLDIIDAASKLSFLTEVVDSYQERLATSCTRRVLEAVALRRAVAKYLVSLGRGRGSGTCIKVRSSPGGILSVAVRTALVVLILLLLLEWSLSIMRRQRRSLVVLLLGRRRAILLAIRRRRRGAILLLAVRLLVLLLGRRRALVVAVLGPGCLISPCTRSRDLRYSRYSLLLIPSTVSSAMRIMVSLAWVCHIERCSRPSAARKCSEQKSTVEADGTVQCLGDLCVVCVE
jgi:hypothetical protein